MREIKFRGKTATVDGQNWVYGHYTRVESFFNDKKKDYIEVIKNNHMQDYAVIEDTVGQYTGLKDKNGVEIYEGDIIKVVYKDETEIYRVRYDEDGTCFRMFRRTDYFEEKFLDFTIHEVDLYEVIGNIYDNPELIEKEGK